ncbi:MAG TPA: glycoside hydrolase family 3 N-terminal domain-containing protein, partial [Gemmatimonadaceae bacterium]|nr:glycoside hydrolase family 3 N-terminal domain-containing protein [Gemmatimonadaceae bacterium]
MRLRVITILAMAGVAAGAQQPAPRPPAAPRYKNSALGIDARVRDLLARMTAEEKFWQLWMVPGDLDSNAKIYEHGVFGLQVRERGVPTPERDPAAAARRMADRLNSIQRFFVEKTRLGIPIIPIEEAVHGLYGNGGTMFPAAIGLAATWSVPMMDSVASAISSEARTRGVRQVLSPVINIANDVRWGRVEETYGEDPWLTSELARAFVTPFEKSGVVTTPKHFIANVGEGGRDSYPIDFDERLLNEIFFPPFKAAIASGARSVMASYNSVDGSPASANEW